MSSVTNFSCVSRNFVQLSAEERAAKRSHLAGFYSSGATASVVIDSQKGLDMYSGGSGEDNVTASGAIYRDGAVFVPAQPLKKIITYTGEERDMLDDLSQSFGGPIVARESFVVTAWFSEMYGGWNVTGSSAINLWSSFSRGGSETVSQGALFDRAVGNMALADGTKPFRDSNDLFESKALDPDYIYFFDVYTGLDSGIMARQETEHLPPMFVFAVSAEDHAVAAPQERVAAIEELCRQPMSPNGHVFEAPFGTGIGVYYKNAKNGERVFVISPEYHALRTEMNKGASKRALYLSSDQRARDVILMVHPDQAEVLRMTEKSAEKLSTWVAEYHLNGRRVFGDRVSKNIIAFANSFSRDCTAEEVMARIKRKPAVSGLSKMLKSISRV